MAYLAVAIVGLQAVNHFVPAITLPSWADELVIALAIFGFLVALVLTWAFEVTNEQYARFVAAGGYEKPEHWVESFVRDGKEVAQEDAVSGFVDRTGPDVPDP